MELKKYYNPKIKAILLKPDQAILQACSVGGVWMASGTPTNYCGITDVGIPTQTCSMGVKSQGTGSNITNISTGAAPS